MTGLSSSVEVASFVASAGAAPPAPSPLVLAVVGVVTVGWVDDDLSTLPDFPFFFLALLESVCTAGAVAGADIVLDCPYVVNSISSAKTTEKSSS